MKKIFFLVLAGLSLSHGFACRHEYQPASTLQCLQNALTITPKLLEKLVYMLCNYEEEIENNKKEFEDDFRELMEILECAGCAVDELIGTKDTVEDLLEDFGGVGKEALCAIMETADKLKLTGPVAHLACSQLIGLGTPGGLVNLGDVLGGLNG